MTSERQYTKAFGSISSALQCSAGQVMGVSPDLAGMILINVDPSNLYLGSIGSTDDIALCSWVQRMIFYGVNHVLLTDEELGPITFHEKDPEKFLNCYRDRANGCWVKDAVTLKNHHFLMRPGTVNPTVLSCRNNTRYRAGTVM